ncbi:MAG: CoB--CoM heterodisulfide reductase iron-sulfur subunit D [Candidatus Thorarchaeota archaeon]|nr:MAG: CoB--CoM heterodisulfide reductase iron-sulfur subunit D [Candidatus Thorarchaeota archaeon]
MTKEPSVISEWLHRCIRCGNCKYIFRDYDKSCPSGQHYRFESYFASGKIWIARGIESKELDFDESLLGPIFSCPTCGSCEIQCQAPHQEHIVDIIEELRAHAVETLGPLPKHKGFLEKIQKHNNPYGEIHHNRELVNIHGLPDKAENVYFVGCTSNYRETSIRDATIHILKTSGMNFTVIDEVCCGSPLLRTGQRAEVKKLVKHNLVKIKEAGAKRIITSCAGCFRTIKKDYQKFEKDFKLEVIHISQLLPSLIESGRLTFKHTKDSPRITYHDPCHLGRHMGVYNEPRNVISVLPVEMVEMSRNRENAWCCGAGGGCRAAFPEFSLATGKVRIAEADEIGAELLVSTCPFCVSQLREVNDTDMKVLDLTELLSSLIR